MEKINITLFLITLLNITVLSQGITIGNSTTITGGSATITLPGNWNNSGTFTAQTGTVIFNGTSGNQTITNTNSETYNNLTLNKAGGNVQLLNNIAVNSMLTITSGNLDLNTKSMSLGSSATVSESAGNSVTGGAMSITQTLNAPSSNNVGGLGAEITSSANFGSTIITRGSAVQTSNSNNSIKRYFDITPTNDTGLNATLVFHYDVANLNGLTESALVLFKSTDNGTTWTNVGGTVNTSAHTVTLNGIDSFSRWTLGSTSSPLPVELVSFAVKTIQDKVILNWGTATEVNNYGFEIERTSPRPSPYQGEGGEAGRGWVKIGFVAGAGNSNSPHSYSFTDQPTGGTSFSYRLKQIDNDGGFKYYDAITVTLTANQKAELMDNYPNPFNPSTAIKFYIPNNSDVTIKIYDMLGREVTTLINNQTSAGYHIVYWNGKDSYGMNAASGVYIYRLTAGNFAQTKKMLMMK